MGKTASGAVWLDPAKTTPYDFYQYWRNVGDADVLKCIRMLTFLPVEEIDRMDGWQGEQLNRAKEILAFELTKLVHGEEEATRAESAAKALFGAGSGADAPTTELSADDLTDGAIDLPSLLVKCELCTSKSEARRNVEQGGVTVEGEKITDTRRTFTAADLASGLLIKRGKKNYRRVIMK